MIFWSGTSCGLRDKRGRGEIRGCVVVTAEQEMREGHVIRA